MCSFNIKSTTLWLFVKGLTFWLSKENPPASFVTSNRRVMTIYFWKKPFNVIPRTIASCHMYRNGWHEETSIAYDHLLLNVPS